MWLVARETIMSERGHLRAVARQENRFGYSIPSSREVLERQGLG